MITTYVALDRCGVSAASFGFFSTMLMLALSVITTVSIPLGSVLFVLPLLPDQMPTIPPIPRQRPGDIAQDDFDLVIALVQELCGTIAWLLRSDAVVLTPVEIRMGGAFKEFIFIHLDQLLGG